MRRRAPGRQLRALGGPGAASGRERADYSEQLRRAARELERTCTWMESKALRLDGLIADIKEYLGDGGLDGGGVRRGRRRRLSALPGGAPEPVLSTVAVHPRGDGCFDVRFDVLEPFQLPPLLGRLLQLLAEDAGDDVNDGLVGFKRNAHLCARLRHGSMRPDAPLPPGGPMTARRLAQAVYDLRERLAVVVANGSALVQTRRGVGRRILVRRRNPTDRG